MNGIFSKLFHKQTDFNFKIGTSPSNPQHWPKTWKEIQYKEYGRFEKIKLPPVLSLGDFKSALENRHSLREFDLSKKVSFEELSTLIYYAAGVRPSQQDDLIRRFYPSGGGRYPLEVYLGIQRVDGLEKGIYHYDIRQNQLEKVFDRSELKNIFPALLYPWSREAAVIFIITAVWDRNFVKYKDRGYRIVLFEAGHLMQNLSLVASALGIGCCNSVGFNNEVFNETLDITNRDEATLYISALGK